MSAGHDVYMSHSDPNAAMVMCAGCSWADDQLMLSAGDGDKMEPGGSVMELRSIAERQTLCDDHRQSMEFGLRIVGHVVAYAAN